VAPVIDRTHQLADAAAAIRHLLDGQTRGKIVVSVHPGDAQAPNSGRPE
jgi:NADPH:quinone reductase-like Zn-dependent oxidoreductase